MGDQDDDAPSRLLILDFGGVCTSGHTDSVATLAGSIRPEAAELVERARQAGVITVILSNEIDPRWADSVPLLGAVDHVVACSDNGIYKPDRRAFQRCLLLTGCRAEHTAVVDDEGDNVTVAASLGMTAITLDPADPAPAWLAAGAWLEQAPQPGDDEPHDPPDTRS